jgi:O-antigen/teichoic acid export membrane protein
MAPEGKSYWIKSGVYTLGSRFSTLFLGFGTFYFLIRYLPQAEFGHWALFLTITTILEASRNGLIQNAFIKLVFSSEPGDLDKVTTAAWVINIFYSILLYILIIAGATLAARMTNSPLSEMFITYGLTLLALIPFSQFNYIQQSKFSFSGIFWSNLARQGTFFASILTVTLMHVKITLIDLVLIQCACTVIGSVVAYFCARKFLIYKFILDWLSIRKVFAFGKYVMGTNIFSLLFKSVDQIQLGYFLNATAVAIYNSAFRLTNLIEYPITAMAEIAYPKSASQFEQDKEKATRHLFEKAVAVTMLFTIPVVLATVVLAEWIILIIAGPEYAPAVDVLRVTVLFGLFTPFTRQFGTAMDSSGRPMINFLVLAGGLIFNIASNLIFIHYFGLMGAAYGTLVSYVVLTLVSYYLMVRIFDISLSRIASNMSYFVKEGYQYVKRKAHIA